jgi:hypothetical protein
MLYSPYNEKLKGVKKMAYTETNFKTKKALKEAVARGEKVRIFSPGPYGCKANGTEYLEGPHYPQPHTWYAQAEVKDYIIIKVK